MRGGSRVCLLDGLFMEIKNLKYSLKAISFALVLSLTGCQNQNDTKKQLCFV